LEDPDILADTQVGWVISHEDVNPREIMERVRGIDGPGAISYRNAHADKVRGSRYMLHTEAHSF